MKFVPAASTDYRDSYLAALAEGFAMVGEHELSAADLAAARQNPDSFFKSVVSPAPIKPPVGEPVPRPPTTLLWWVDETSFIGTLYIHHVLPNAMYAAYGGHIAYAVRPSRRGQGHATKMLAASVPIAASLGIERALICVRSENTASRHIIERQGGLFMDEIPITYDLKPGAMRRYILPTHK